MLELYPVLPLGTGTQVAHVCRYGRLNWEKPLEAIRGSAGLLTTMSSFALDSSNLLESNHYGTLVINVVANIGLSIAALIGGKSLMSAIINN